jgi:hypothetical protein
MDVSSKCLIFGTLAVKVPLKSSRTVLIHPRDGNLPLSLSASLGMAIHNRITFHLLNFNLKETLIRGFTVSNLRSLTPSKSTCSTHFHATQSGPQAWQHYAPMSMSKENMQFHASVSVHSFI